MKDLDFCNELENYAKSFNRKMKIENKSKNTIESYNRTYKDFIDFCRTYEKKLNFKNIKEEDIYAFIEYKSEKMNKHGEASVSTVNSIVVHLKRLFKHIERNSDDLYDFDRVFEDIKLKQPKRKPKGISEDDIFLLEKQLVSMKEKGSVLDFRNVLLFKMMLYGGLRASEATSVCLKDISEEGNGLYKIQFKGKGEKNRTSYLHKIKIEDEILSLIELGIDANKPIATTRNGNRMDRVQLSKMVNSIYRRAGLNLTGVHILRHTAAKRLLGDGVSIVVVQSLLGHSSIQTTSIYANPTEDIIKKELCSSNNKE